MKVAFREEYVQALPEGHRFPMEKYDLLPKQLLHEGTIGLSELIAPEEIDRTFIEAVHDPEYVDRLFHLKLSEREQRVSGFPHNKALIKRECIIMEGTRICAEYALKEKVAMNIAGGTHHAYTNRGEGFCLLNDQAIAAKWLLDKEIVQKILIIDLDVHQGNGTASIFSNNSQVFTFSMHGKNNYPLKKELSDLDVELNDGISDNEYLFLLEKSLDNVCDGFKPDFVFYQSGVDVIETDKLGKLALTLNGCRKRDRMVFETVRQLDVPVVCSMGGGYSPQIKHIVEAHANTFREAQFVLL
jgi:acetoin utilization deacetylase AcuC-like enzyme